MQEIIIGKKTYTGPGSWKEMTADNFLKLSTCIRMNTDGESTEAIFINSALVFALFGIPAHIGANLKEFQCLQLTEVLDFLNQTNEQSTWLFPKIRFVGSSNWYGPADRLANLTALEFIQAEAYYERYSINQDEKYLDGLISILYRPKAMFSEKRVEFSVDASGKYEKRASSLPLNLKLAIYTNYTGCRNLVIRLHPNLFYRDSKKLEAKNPQPIQWNTHLIQAAGGPLGEYESIKKQNIWIVLKYMDDLAADRRKK